MSSQPVLLTDAEIRAMLTRVYVEFKKELDAEQRSVSEMLAGLRERSAVAPS